MTYISIDMDNLQVVHKHHDQLTTQALGWLEMPDRSVMISNIDSAHFLCQLSDLDARMLYFNLTGEKVPLENAMAVRQMIYMVVEKMLPTIAVMEELQAQINLVEALLYKGERFKYARGSRKPAQPIELFPLKGTPLDDAAKAQATQLAPQRLQKRAAPIAAPVSDSVPVASAAPKQRASSVRPVIWAVADRMWEAAGKPMDKNTVLELRKKMMATLESENAVKKTSSSNELGNWMKARLG